MTSHFDTIADIYDKVWFFSEDYQTTMLHNITELLDLRSDDILADLGGGTGVYTRLLKDFAQLHAAYCIEPSRNMYLEACKIPTIMAIQADAKAFLDLNLPFTKLLIKEAIHHIQQREKLWAFCRGALPPEGRILIVTRPQDIALPLFDRAKETFRHHQPHHDTLMKELQSGGFNTTMRSYPYVFKLTKEIWFEMIRKRFMSDLAKFTEEEIEAGIGEIDHRHAGNEVEISDTIIYIAAYRGDK